MTGNTRGLKCSPRVCVKKVYRLLPHFCPLPHETPFPVAFCVNGVLHSHCIPVSFTIRSSESSVFEISMRKWPDCRILLTSTSGTLLRWGNISGVSSSIHTFIPSLTFSGQGEVNTKIFCTSVKWIKFASRKAGAPQTNQTTAKGSEGVDEFPASTRKRWDNGVCLMVTEPVPGSP